MFLGHYIHSSALFSSCPEGSLLPYFTPFFLHSSQKVPSYLPSIHSSFTPFCTHSFLHSSQKVLSHPPSLLSSFSPFFTHSLYPSFTPYSLHSFTPSSTPSFTPSVLHSTPFSTPSFNLKSNRKRRGAHNYQISSDYRPPKIVDPESDQNTR